MKYTAIYDWLVAFRDVLRTSFAQSQLPPVNYAIRVGEEFSMDMGGVTDMCCDGTVALLALDCEQIPGTELSGLPVSFTQDFVILVLRCSPTVDDMGRFPGEAEQDLSVQLLLDDRERLLASMAEYVETLDLADGEYINVTVRAVEPQGGCCGNAMSFTAAITQDC